MCSASQITREARRVDSLALLSNLDSDSKVVGLDRAAQCLVFGGQRAIERPQESGSKSEPPLTLVVARRAFASGWPATHRALHRATPIGSVLAPSSVNHLQPQARALSQRVNGQTETPTKNTMLVQSMNCHQVSVTSTSRQSRPEPRRDDRPLASAPCAERTQSCAPPQ